jgi:NAD(P)-dependent dehydrogenase (short-subunit alcohol dehydrogenase family)
MKYAIVTGGARGLGLGIVRALLEDNVVGQVAVVDRELRPPPKEVADRVHGFTADVTNEIQVRTAIDALTAKLGTHPDVLCNNAGGGDAQWFESGRHEQWHSVDIWRSYVELNLNSVYLVCKEVVPRMERGGAICNTSSIAGMLATPFLAAYAAAKAGVISYSRSLALQLGPAGIRVNAVAPGLIYTKIWEDLGAAIGGGKDRARLAFEGAVRNLVPLGREQTPEDIGRTVAWLCSKRAENVTGQVIAIDGGIVLGPPPRRHRQS